MKLALRQEDGCSVLEVQGSVDSHNITVLKAGLSKLFQNGKNRVVLHFLESNDISNEVIRELAILDVFARELSGKLVLVSDNPDLKIKVTTFAKPPVVGILPTVAKAVAYLRDLDSLDGEEGGENLAEITQKLDAKTRQVAALEAQLKQVDPAVVQKIRSENAELKNKVKLLEGQVGELLNKRAQPAHADGFNEKIEALEDALRRMGGEKLAAGAKN